MADGSGGAGAGRAREVDVGVASVGGRSCARFRGRVVAGARAVERRAWVRGRRTTRLKVAGVGVVAGSVGSDAGCAVGLTGAVAQVAARYDVDRVAVVSVRRRRVRRGSAGRAPRARGERPAVVVVAVPAVGVARVAGRVVGLGGQVGERVGVYRARPDGTAEGGAFGGIRVVLGVAAVGAVVVAARVVAAAYGVAVARFLVEAAIPAKSLAVVALGVKRS